jgi:AraC-like DNA-binding protein
MPHHFEKILTALEEELGVMITLHDLGGIFHDPFGHPLLETRRQSHRRAPLCFTGERAVCVSHCMEKINSLMIAQSADWFVNQCVYGLTEMIAPIRRGGLPVAVLFAGTWRMEPSAKIVPEQFQRLSHLKKAFLNLPVFEEGRGERIGSILANAGQGLVAELDRLLEVDTHEGNRKEEIRRFITLNASRKVSTRDLADVLHLSVSRSGHLVEELFGISFSKLLTQERVMRAQTLLRSTDMRVGDIAQKAGFGNEYHFSRMFKREKGIAPGKFRRQFLADKCQ